MGADVTREFPQESIADPWVSDLVERLDSGDGDVNDLGRLALRLADLGQRDGASRVLERIPPDSPARESVAARLGLDDANEPPPHSKALGDAFARSLGLRSVVLAAAASVAPGAAAWTASLAGPEAATLAWLLAVHGQLVLVWPVLADLARGGAHEGIRGFLRGAAETARREGRASLVLVGAATLPAILCGLLLPAAGMVLLVVGLAALSAIAATPEGPLRARLGRLRHLRRSAPAEVSLVASTGALWGLAALVGWVAARTGAAGATASALVFFLCAALCARLAAGARLRIVAASPTEASRPR